MIKQSMGFFIACLYSMHVFSANLLFKSGFESNVAILPMTAPYNRTTSYQDITGSDVPGKSWPMHIRTSTQASLHHIINAHSNPPPPVPDLNKYFDTHIETVNGHDGLNTRALYQSLTQKASRLTQSWYTVYYSSPSAASDGDVYFKYWMKLPDDFKESMGPQNWRSVIFWKTSNDDYRIEAYINTTPNINNGMPYWHIHGDRFTTVDGNYKVDWDERNVDVAVPIGEWFLVEFFWHRSTSNDGRVFWAVNGKVIADHYGPNYGDYKGHINRVSPFGVYTTPAVYPARQWIDDVEVWDGSPCGDGISCFDPTRLPPIDIEKLTNGNHADGVNDPDVPQIAQGEALTWTYKVTNTGDSAISESEIVVTDSQPGVVPGRDIRSDAGADSILSPGETWIYTATSQALDLEDPPQGITVVQGCGDNRNTYENTGRAEIPGTGVIDEDLSHYCNPVMDTDGDGIPDIQDNCLDKPNPDQRDTDGDGYGNFCDPDSNQNGVIDSTDLSIIISTLRSSTSPDQDLNGNGVVDATDYSIANKFHGKPPGPSCCGILLP